MNRVQFIFYLFLSVCLPEALHAQWSVSGGLYSPYTLDVAPSTGLDQVYLLYGTRSLELSYMLSSNHPVKLFRYDRSALQSQEIPFQIVNQRVVVTDPQPDYGYFIEQDGRVLSYTWLIDYQAHQLEIESLQVQPQQPDCFNTKLSLERTAPDLFYFTINGQRKDIERQLILRYATLKWDDENRAFIPSQREEKVRAYTTLNVEAPLVDTEFIILGDQFLSFWGIPQEAKTETYITTAVDGRAFAKQTIRDAGNELDKDPGDKLGGSAPVEILFQGYANEPTTTFVAWEFSRDPNFEVIDASYNESELEFSFEEEGTTYVRFVINNAQGDCLREVNQFEVSTVESFLEVPNVFTPQSSSGNNQVFKVAYKSILRFQAIVFNRWGNELFRWTDPSQGWDGKYKGKYVPTGAYFYIITAEGVGGKEYELKGDINVLNTIK